MCLALGQNPREVARIFYQAEGEEMNPVDFINLQESEPCVFYIWEGEGWFKDPCRRPIRKGNAITFDVFVSSTEEWEPYTMRLESDGLYHWRDPDGPPGHWWAFLSEGETHLYLVGNYINPDEHQGVQIFVWPKS